MLEFTPVRFARPRSGSLKISDGACRTFEEHRQVGEHTLEAGGVLLGRLLLDSDDVVVDEATTPCGHDRRTRRSFWRAREPAQKIVNRAWDSSRGTRNYLGEWHTHDEPVPQPSQQDLKDWLRITRDARYDQDFLIFAIVGHAGLGVWEVDRQTGLVTRLEASSTTSEISAT